MTFMAEDCVYESTAGPEVDGCDLFTFAGDKIARKSSFFKTRTP